MCWDKFKLGKWNKKIDVEDFIKLNYSLYLGDESFLSCATTSSKALNKEYYKLLESEKILGGVIDMDTKIASTITSHKPGYINKDLEQIVGLQTEKPLKRAFFPNGGIRVAKKACESYGYEIEEEVERLYTMIRKTHNHGVYDVYTKDIVKARHSHLLLGLPDSYGRGRIIGDYRRVALYGIDFLILDKKKEKDSIKDIFSEDKIKLREELEEQIRSLKDLKTMALSYGIDISKPAKNAKEAIQWMYFGYLGAIKEQNGAAMSFGRIDSFIDIYIQRDLESGLITETQAQEYIDHFIMKLRMVRFARTPEYNSLFSGDPVWATISIGGILDENRSLITKTSYRLLHTLYNLNTAPEPNLTVLWSKYLPTNFKNYIAKVCIDTSSIQIENDDLIRPLHGSDYGIACCVSPLSIGKELQFFGARCNLAKVVLYAINKGYDEILEEKITPDFTSNTNIYNEDGSINYNEFMKVFKKQLHYLTKIYTESLNIIHYMHDKYNYEKLEMALHDKNVVRYFSTGIAGFSVVVDSLSAIKYASVYPIKNDNGIVVDYKVVGDYPKFGNNDDRSNDLAYEVCKMFYDDISKYKTYRKSIHSVSILTITSNVVYGKNTGATPDGRKANMPFAPGANPMHGRDESGALASLMSIAKLPFSYSTDGISNTFSIIPNTLGKTKEEQISNLTTILDGYFNNNGYHINVNVLSRELLIDAYNNPANYPNLTIRVSGYAVRFNSLTDEQKQEVILRTFHER